MEQGQENRLVPPGRLVGASVQLHQLLGGRSEPVYLDVLEASPVGFVLVDVTDPRAGISDQKGPLVMDPASYVFERGENPVDGGSSQLLLLVQQPQKPLSDGLCPLVRMICACCRLEVVHEFL